MDTKNTAELAEKHRNWPNTIRNRDELDSALEAGEKSGVSELTIEQVAERKIAQMKADGEL